MNRVDLHTSPRRGGVQDMKLLVWNIRGAGNRHFLNELKGHHRLHRLHILALLETYISGDGTDEVCRRSEFDKWYRVEAQGFQGGIWLLWNSHKITVEIIQPHVQYITVEVHGGQTPTWLFTAVYMSPHWQDKEQC